MNLTFFLLQGSDPAPTPPGPGNPLAMFFPFMLMLGVFYFLIILPQNKKRKEHQKMLDSLKKGDRVVTRGGIYGTVVAVKEKVITLKISPEVKVDFSKSAISYLVKEQTEPPKSKK
jgi:preprotein translocase subunit YajC